MCNTLLKITVQLSDAVKHGAASLGSQQPDSQVMVMNAVKDVASALGELINATKLASGKPINDPAMNDLKECAKVSHFNSNFEKNSQQKMLKIFPFFLYNIKFCCK